MATEPSPRWLWGLVSAIGVLFLGGICTIAGWVGSRLWDHEHRLTLLEANAAGISNMKTELKLEIQKVHDDISSVRSDVSAMRREIDRSGLGRP